mmetsp:Transcript_3237/g.5511  ORF Transcript_3237/g.5511 Transcript_3237/m.5511 type:complete len:294 (+) Transcript_3237:363-1244(+)
MRKPLLVFPLLGVRGGAARLGRLHDRLRQMAMALDALNLVDVVVALHQRLVVRRLPLLAGQHRPELLASMRLPDAQVHVVGAAQHVGGVATISCAEHTLHALGVEYLTTVAGRVREDAHGTVVRSRDELPPGGGVVQVHYRRHKVLVHAGGDLQLAHVVAVEVAVLVGHGEVERLHRVPRDRVRLVLHDQFAHGGAHAQVVQADAAVCAARSEHVRLRRIEAHGQDSVRAPRKRVDGLRAVVIPHLHRARGRHKHVFLVVVVDPPERALALVRLHRLLIRNAVPRGGRFSILS